MVSKRKKRQVVKNLTQEPTIVKLNVGFKGYRSDQERAELDGFVNVSESKKEGTNVVCHPVILNSKYQSNSVDEIYCRDLFQYLSLTDRNTFIKGCYSILKQGGKLTIIFPDINTHWAIAHPKTTWPPPVPESFLFYNKNWLKQSGNDAEDIGVDFEFTYVFSMNPTFMSKSEEARNYAIQHYNNVVLEIRMILTKR